jgi:hypothetical protein
MATGQNYVPILTEKTENQKRWLTARTQGNREPIMYEKLLYKIMNQFCTRKHETPASPQRRQGRKKTFKSRKNIWQLVKIMYQF